MYYILRSIFKNGINTPIKDGYIPDELSDKDFVHGIMGQEREVVRADGQYLDFLPEEERQSGRKTDSFNCTNYGLNNYVETYLLAKYGIRVNKSDRYAGKTSNTTKNGNSMKNVIDNMRKVSGAVPEDLWPSNIDSATWEEYYSSIPKTVMDVGRAWIPEFDIVYYNVGNNRTLMMDAMKYGPLYVSGYAWYYENGLYRSYGQHNHCFIIVGYEYGKCWYAFDSYSPFVKKLAWDYQFGAVWSLDVIALNPAEIERKKLLEKGYKYVMRVENRGEIYRLSDMKQIPVEELIAEVKNEIKSDESQSIVDDIIRKMFALKYFVPINEQIYTKLK